MKNKNLLSIILIYIVIQVILDIFVTMLPELQINLIIRGIFFIFTILYLLKDKKNIKMNIFLLVMMTIYLLYSKFYLDYSLFESINVTFKLFYLAYMLVLFSNVTKTKEIKEILLASLLLYMGMFLISYIFKIGYSNYLSTDGKTGYRGLFNSINEYSAILVILYYYVFNYLKTNNRKIINIVITILLFIISYLTGTKVLFGGTLLVIAINLIPDIANYFKEGDNAKKIKLNLLIVISFVLLCFIFTKTNTYKNMLVQAKFFKVYNVFSLDFVNKVLFNDRLSFLISNNRYYLSNGIIKMLFGIGYKDPFKLVEIDFFDILYRYGIIGIISIVSIFTHFIKTNKLSKLNTVGIILLILISFTSGHVLLNPSVSIYFGVIMLLNKEKVEGD